MTNLHLRVDDEELNANRRFACGIGPALPEGDMFLFDGESHLAGVLLAKRPEVGACPGCFPGGRPRFGTPLSELSGRAGSVGYERFRRIARSWGYD